MAKINRARNRTLKREFNMSSKVVVSSDTLIPFSIISLLKVGSSGFGTERVFPSLFTFNTSPWMDMDSTFPSFTKLMN